MEIDEIAARSKHLHPSFVRRPENGRRVCRWTTGGFAYLYTATRRNGSPV